MSALHTARLARPNPASPGARGALIVRALRVITILALGVLSVLLALGVGLIWLVKEMDRAESEAGL